MSRFSLLIPFSSVLHFAAFLSLGAPTCRADDRIPLTPNMIINESGFGDASALVDEQDAIGDPGSGKGLRPTHPFFPGWTAWQYPLHVVIDLKTDVQISRVFLYNETGESPLVLQTGIPKAWKDYPITLNGYREWKSFPIGESTRYLRITLLKPSSLPELALYGTKQARAAVVPTYVIGRAPQRVRTSMDQLIGTNAFIDDPIDKLAVPVGFVREYHNWSWDTEAPDGKVRFQPSGAAGGKSWFFDDFYAKLKAHQVMVCPAIQNSSPAYFKGEPDYKPVADGADPEDPASYIIHASHLFQYAARYGSTKVADSMVVLAADQPRTTGENSLHYFEDWNEPDKTWKGREGRFNPFDLAAMCSADYDGDQGRLGKSAGIKNADPNAKLVMGGLADMSITYLNAMKFWADTHRNGDFPADVINVHHYSNDGTPEKPFRNTGISPEEDHLKEKLAEIVQWRNKNVPKAEVWLTEFGYDTNPKSPFHAPAIGPYSGEEVQANWLVRSYLALAAAGVDRAAQFMFRDTKSDGGGVFETCGMVTEKGQWKPKPSYYYIATLKNRLTGMSFAGEIDTGRKDVLAYRFERPGGRSAVAVWRPTSDGGTSTNVKLNINMLSASIIHFTTGDSHGEIASDVQTTAGTITLDVFEKPVLIVSH